MFGHYSKKSAKAKANAGPSQPNPMTEDDKKAKIAEQTSQASEDRKKARQEGRQHAEELLNDPSIVGMDPKRYKTMQYEANKQIQRAHQSANRKLLGEQGMRGVTGKGGVGYAQQRDLMRMADEAYGQSTRDLNKLNDDLRMKKIASIFAGEQGEAAQAMLDKQLAQDQLNYEEERKKNQLWEDYFNRQFSRI